jgi:hypothetical protein
MTTTISNQKKPILKIPLESAALDRTEQLLKNLKKLEMIPL